MKRTNRRTRYLGAAFAVLMALVFGSFAFGATSARGEEGADAAAPAQSTAETVPGEVLVLFDDPEAAELSVEAAEGGVQALSLEGEGELNDVPADAPAEEAAPVVVEGFEVEEAEVIAPDVDGQTIVSLELADEGETDALIDALDAIKGVSAQPNYVYQLMDDGVSAPLTNDEYADLEYFLGPLGDGTDSSGSNFYAAWQEFLSVDSPSSVTVAVIDTGIDPTHPDLQDNVRYDLAYDAVNDRKLTGDAGSHGTAVAGVIAATANNEIGVVGAASGAHASLTAPKVKVIPVGVFDGPSETSTSYIIRGANYVIDLVKDGKVRDLRVANFSLGIFPEDDDTEFDPAFKSVIDGLIEQGVLCVAAGGNGVVGPDGTNIGTTQVCYPSDYDPVLSVTALTENGANAGYSDYNLHKDISAPGNDIATTSPEGGYVWEDGTSFSSPIVASAAAILCSANPNLTPAELSEIICDTAAPLPSDENSHAGETGSVGALDAHAALVEAIARAGSKPSDGTTPAYRLYNRWTGAHLVTTSKDESMQLRGDNYGSWLADGICFTVLPAASTEGRPIYRVYNPYNGDHFYTESDAEAANLASHGWRREGIAWRAADAGEGVPVYRLYNPYMKANGGLGNHLWTISASENADLSSHGWISESAAWRAVR